MNYNTQRSEPAKGIDPSLLASNIPPISAAVMTQVIKNHLSIAQSTSADPVLVSRSRKELERFKDRPEVAAYLAETEQNATAGA